VTATSYPSYRTHRSDDCCSSSVACVGLSLQDRETWLAPTYYRTHRSDDCFSSSVARVGLSLQDRETWLAPSSLPWQWATVFGNTNNTLVCVHVHSVLHVTPSLSGFQLKCNMAFPMVSSGILRRVALVRTDVSEELSASFIRVIRIGELGTTLAVTSNLRTLRRNIYLPLSSFIAH
jgi:hypothetical protein